MRDLAHNLTVLVNSTDTFSDCWPPFFQLFKRYWPECPCPIILNTETKDYRDAAFHFEQSLQSNPSNADAHHNYGLVLALMQENAGAVRELRHAIELHPQDDQAHLDLADVLASSGRRLEAAREYEAASRSADPGVREAAATGLRSVQR